MSAQFPHPGLWIKTYRTVKDPLTGRITYECTERKWVKTELVTPELRDAVQGEHPRYEYLTFRVEDSQEDRDKVASEWAGIWRARDAAKEAARMEEAAKREERRRRIDAMVEESEGVAWNIAKADEALRTAAEGKKAKAKAWMDVVMR